MKNRGIGVIRTIFFLFLLGHPDEAGYGMFGTGEDSRDKFFQKRSSFRSDC